MWVVPLKIGFPQLVQLDVVRLRCACPAARLGSDGVTGSRPHHHSSPCSRLHAQWDLVDVLRLEPPLFGGAAGPSNSWIDLSACPVAGSGCDHVMAHDAAIANGWPRRRRRAARQLLPRSCGSRCCRESRSRIACGAGGARQRDLRVGNQLLVVLERVVMWVPPSFGDGPGAPRRCWGLRRAGRREVALAVARVGRRVARITVPDQRTRENVRSSRAEVSEPCCPGPLSVSCRSRGFALSRSR